MSSKKTYWYTNEGIRAQELRVIGADGKQIGILSKQDALKEAKKAGLDLVQIAPKAKPPVAKIVEFGKFKYQEEKKLKEQKKKAKNTELKEIRLSPFIAAQDYRTRLARITGFLKGGHKVRAVVVFKGRQMGSKPFGYNLLRRLIDSLEEQDIATSIDMEPKFVGRHLAMVLSPIKKVKKQENAKAEDKKISK